MVPLGPGSGRFVSPDPSQAHQHRTKVSCELKNMRLHGYVVGGQSIRHSFKKCRMKALHMRPRRYQRELLS